LSAARRFALLAALVAGAASCDRDGASAKPPASPPQDGPRSVASRPSPSTFRFVDVSAASGATFVARTADPPRYIPEAKGGGVALFDQDGDGILDLVVAAGSTVEREARGEPGFGLAFYRGLGDCKFRDATREVGLDVPLPWLAAAVAADYDGDDRADLLLTGPGGLRLFRNEGGRFVDATTALPASARERKWSASAAFADLDGDEDLDLFVCRYLSFDFAHPPRDGLDGRTCRRRGRPVLCGPRGLDALPDLALKNRGDGSFEDASTEWGFAAATPAYGLGVTTLDFDADGKTDVFVANDATPNHLWRNEGGRFVEVAGALGVAWTADGAPQAGMGVDAADLNGDGVEDLVLTNFETEPDSVYLSAGALGWIESSSRVRTAGVDRPYVGWGVGLRDFDGDGTIDVFVANGHVYADADPDQGSPWTQPCVLHRGRADGTFERFRGPEAAALDLSRCARAAAFGDLDDDGDVDVVVSVVNGAPVVLRADLPGDLPWYGVRVRGPAKNRAALGAKVELRSEGRPRRATVRAHASFQASNDPRVVFRLPAGSPAPTSIDVELAGKKTGVAPRRGAYVEAWF
jgi:enediyne biosynthesis protein E4